MTEIFYSLQHILNTQLHYVMATLLFLLFFLKQELFKHVPNITLLNKQKKLGFINDFRQNNIFYNHKKRIFRHFS
ncbi:hypothetical protein BpHYR1_020791 [Brachionus plicatilis]|uniref:Uncharacterized protein n=1 Tax=Brachionus plicatilis TaxID=10195 RepID=A0A3M7S857_BRAPC|nr:hypothetical protein BpHYR1_020791 [Brachionus plicatilis]